jgi:membrane protease YdiL (CAAX protease family)
MNATLPRARPSAPRVDARTVTLAAGLTAVGVLFNLARLLAGLDRGPLLASIGAFMVLAAIAVALGRSLGLGAVELGCRRPLATPSVVGGLMAFAVLAGAAWASSAAVRVPSLTQFGAGLLLFGLGTAPAEELLFRGVLYRIVERSSGAPAAIVVTAVSFAVAHVPVYGLGSLPLAISAGLVLGWLRWWSGSLVAPVAVHVAADLAILWL